ncbi:MAG TPA: hypothetical protein VGP81_09830 [Pyrinomonadaceae bacterium]|jgi:hypothetical protein|nr:hypothetical protein [Pyrinomonadaceae bacterium]
MRPVNGQTVSEKEERDDELQTCVVDLTPRVEVAEGVGSTHVRNQETEAVVSDADDSSQPIEFITENGYSIVRPWESGNSPRPTGGRYRFGVSDGFIEREVRVEISRRVVSEMSLRSRGRIECSNSFWICCAERHLANYVTEHADFPEDDKLIVEKLNREDILLALRWEKSG